MRARKYRELLFPMHANNAVHGSILGCLFEFLLLLLEPHLIQVLLEFTVLTDFFAWFPGVLLFAPLTVPLEEGLRGGLINLNPTLLAHLEIGHAVIAEKMPTKAITEEVVLHALPLAVVAGHGLGRGQFEPGLQGRHQIDFWGTHDRHFTDLDNSWYFDDGGLVLDDKGRLDHWELAVWEGDDVGLRKRR